MRGAVLHSVFPGNPQGDYGRELSGRIVSCRQNNKAASQINLARLLCLAAFRHGADASERLGAGRASGLDGEGTTEVAAAHCWVLRRNGTARGEAWGEGACRGCAPVEPPA
jgi:hypothetical protein